MTRVPCITVVIGMWNHTMSLLEKEHQVNLKHICVFFYYSPRVQQTDIYKGRSISLNFHSSSCFSVQVCRFFLLLSFIIDASRKVLLCLKPIHPLFDSPLIKLRVDFFKRGSVILKFNFCSCFFSPSLSFLPTVVF